MSGTSPYSATIFEGTSFSWQLLKTFDAINAFQAWDFYYYNRSKIRRGEKRRSPIKAGAIHWKDELKTKKVVLFEINESVFESLGHGSVEDMIRALY